MTENAVYPADAKPDPDPLTGPVDDRINLGSLASDLGFALRLAQLAVFKELASAFRPLDLRPGQYAALKLIAANPGLPQGRLGRVLMIQKTNLVALIDAFERRGLVTRERAAGDARLRTLALSPQGVELLRKADRIQAAQSRRLEAILGPVDKSQFIAQLNRLGEAMDRPDD